MMNSVAHLLFDLTHEKREKEWRAGEDRCPSHVANIGPNRSKHNGYLCRFLRWFFPDHEHRRPHDGQQPQQQTIRCWGRIGAASLPQRPDRQNGRPRRGTDHRCGRQESRSMGAFLWYMANIGPNDPKRNRGPCQPVNWLRPLDRITAGALPWPHRGPWPDYFSLLCAL